MRIAKKGLYMEKDSLIYVLDSNPNSVEILKSYLLEEGYLNVKTFTQKEECLSASKIEERDITIFVNIDAEGIDNNLFLEDLKLLVKRIVMTSDEYSTDMIIKAFRYGALDFLPKPILKNQLVKTLERLVAIPEESVQNSSKIITIYSNKGGIGKTTVAINFAAELAKTTRSKVALVDLNLQLGDVSTFLNLNPKFDVAYVVKKLLKEDNNTLTDVFERYKETNLYILSDSTFIDQSENITPIQIESLFTTLRKKFSYIVIDMSSDISANTLKILDKSDYIMFTSIVNIPAIRNTQRCLSLFKTRRYSEEKVKIIINRYMDSDDIKIEDIENTIGQKIYWKLPNNYFSIMEAINRGEVVSDISPNSNIANSFKDLSIKLSDDIVKQDILKYKNFN